MVKIELVHKYDRHEIVIEEIETGLGFDADENFLFVVNKNGGRIAAFPVKRVVQAWQDGPPPAAPARRGERATHAV